MRKLNKLQNASHRKLPKCDRLPRAIVKSNIVHYDIDHEGVKYVRNTGEHRKCSECYLYEFGFEDCCSKYICVSGNFKKV